MWPLQLRTESSHEEGGIREWSLNSVKFTGDAEGRVTQIHALRVGPPPKFEPIAGSEFVLDVDLVLLAMGFLGPVRSGMIEQLGLDVDGRGNVATTNYKTSADGIFAAGDMRRGQSLVVWAIAEGRKAAAAVDEYLQAKAEPLALRHRAAV
jgi:glutamate synthase (NADPH/NADH) small chain